MKALLWTLVAALVLVVTGSIVWQQLPEEEQHAAVRSLRMEVVNGSGVSRAGRAVADELAVRGFDVYSVRGGEPRVRTVVVDLRERSGRNAVAVARAISVQRRWRRLPLGPRAMPQTIVALDSAKYLEVSLVLGQDFRRFFPKAAPRY